jgi:formylglycine-generating enzyme required for sulfatase activity
MPGSDCALPLALLGNPKPLVMLWITPGTFVMGSPKDEVGRSSRDENQFEASVGSGFWLGQCLVTQAQWVAVNQSNPSYFQVSSNNRPVETVTWHDTLAFCDKLTAMLTDRLPKSYAFSLPTEMQWEYACRAGTTSSFYWGDSAGAIAEHAWFKESSGGETHAVGEKRPNGWGFYDLQGNVFEWCYDAVDEYPKHSATDWVGSSDPSLRAFRGTSYGTSAVPDGREFRLACRGWVDPSAKRAWFGFRLCLRRPPVK